MPTRAPLTPEARQATRGTASGSSKRVLGRRLDPAVRERVEWAVPLARAAVAPVARNPEAEADAVAVSVARWTQERGPQAPAGARRTDFSGIRVHTDEHHVRSPAVAIGDDVFFAPGRFRPSSQGGLALLAHELAHVSQQREAGRVTAQAASAAWVAFNLVPVLNILYWTGAVEVPYSDEALREYLRDLQQRGTIEDNIDSDDKARAVVRSWNESETRFTLTARIKALLIREMLSGSVSRGDRTAILSLLERSEGPELEYIFGSGRVSHSEIIRRLESRELNVFYRRRFPGAFAGEDMLDPNLDTPPDPRRLTDENAQPSGRQVQVGDPVPSDTGRGETRRTRDPIPLGRADALVLAHYRRYMQADEQRELARRPIPGDRFHLMPPDDFRQTLLNVCYSRQINSRSTDAERQRARSVCDYEASTAAGFYDPDDDSITVAQGIETPTTRLHETVHRYTHANVRSELARYASEGLTEYFTRRLAHSYNREPGRRTGEALPTSDSYGGPVQVFLELEVTNVMSHDNLARVFFGGEIGLLRTALGNQFEAWNSAMQTQSGWTDAVQIVLARRRRNP